MDYVIEVLNSKMVGSSKEALIEIVSTHLSISEETANIIVNNSPCIISGIRSIDLLDKLVNALKTGGFSVKIVNDRDDKKKNIDLDGFIDYYEILEIHSNASFEEIRKSYYRLSKEYHPDKFINKEFKKINHQIQQTINEAYAVLKDANRRNEYDEKYHLFLNNPEGKEAYLSSQKEFKIAMILLSKNEINSAIDSLNRVLAIYPQHHEARMLLAFQYLSKKEYEKAKTTAMYLLNNKDFRNRCIFVLALVNIYSEEGSIKEAKAQIDTLLAEVPDESYSHYVKGLANYFEGNRMESIKYLKKANLKHPHDEDIQQALITIYMDIHDFRNAGKMLNKILSNYKGMADFDKFVESQKREYKHIAELVRTANKIGNRLPGDTTNPIKYVAAFILCFIPPFFIGIILLISHIVFDNKSKKEFNEYIESFHLKRNIPLPSLEELNPTDTSFCLTCSYLGKSVFGDGKCTQMNKNIYFNESMNPCKGFFFYTNPIEINGVEQGDNYTKST
ncbi:MAG: DnaJ domain-containing protein [bacterium]|nr:DnaJ domain-containing protein [bacterium]